MIRCRILGPISLSGPDERPLDEVVAQPRRLALLVYLAMQAPRGFTRRDELLPFFWPELDQERARGALRQALYFLRSAVGDDVVVSRGVEEVAIATDRMWCDALEFERAYDEKRWADALALYRGDFLRAFFIAEAPQFEQWMQDQQGRLRLRAGSAARSLAAAQEVAGSLPEATGTARRALALNPSDEESLRHLITLLDRQGDRAGAVREYDAFVSRLSEEMGVPPSAETVAVYERIRRRDEPRSGSRPPADASAPALERTPATRRRAPRPRTLAVAVVVLLATVFLLQAAWARFAPNDPLERVAILPFEIRGGPEHLYLREALVDLLSTDLDGAGGIQTIDPNAVRAAASPKIQVPDDGRTIARRLGARYYILGSAVVAGANLRVTSALYDQGNGDEPVAQATREGTAEQLFSIVDGLAADLLVATRGTPDVRMSQSAALTTQSLPALKAYLEGEREFLQGDEPRAYVALRRAIALDSTFALANYKLSVVVDARNGPWTEITESAERALRHASRLSERDRLLLEAHMASVVEDVGSAEQQYRAIVTRYPDELEAWYRLAEVIFHQNPITGRSVVDARDPFERLLRLDPTNRAALMHLLRIAAVEKRKESIDTLYERILAARLTPIAEHEARAIWVFTNGSLAEREKFLADFATAPPGAPALWVMNVFVKDLDATRRLMEIRDSTSRSSATHRSALSTYARIHVAQGQMDSADAKLREAAKLDSDRAVEQGAFIAIMPFRPLSRAALQSWRARVAAWDPPSTDARTQVSISVDGPNRKHVRFFLLGHLDALLGDTAAVRAAADSLERLPVPPLPDARVFARELGASIRAHSLWRQGNVPAALALLERTPRARQSYYRLSAMRPQNRYVLAELLFEAGRNAEALKWFGSFDYNVLLEYGFSVPAHMRRGQIYERLGNPTQAAMHYREFLASWQHADPSLQPVIKAAEDRLNQLSVK